MTLRSLTFPRGPVFDADGKLAVGHALACYNPETDTLRTWYADADLTISAPNPDRVAADGLFAQKFLGEGPVEIRQYAPVSSSSVIPDNLQEFPGSEWTLVASWLEDGLPKDQGALIPCVDTVDQLRMLQDKDAQHGLVAVRGYYNANDGTGVRFYQYDSNSNLPDDGGAVLSSTMGGKWLLKVDGPEVPVSWWGAVPGSTQDGTGAISAAAAWGIAKGATIYFPKGTYTVASGAVSLGSVHFDDGAQFQATSGSYALTLTGAWRIDGLGDFKASSSPKNVGLMFASTAAPGALYTSWNGARSFGNGYNGHDVVVNSAVDVYIYASTKLKTVRVDVDARLSIFSDGGSIEALIPGSGQITGINHNGDVKVSIGTTYASAFARVQESNVAKYCSIGTLVLDTDLSFSTLDVEFGEIVAAGGKITSAGSVACGAVSGNVWPCFGGDVKVACASEGLDIAVFDDTKTEKALWSVANSNRGIVDLCGSSVTIGGTLYPVGSLVGYQLPQNAGVIRNGRISAIESAFVLVTHGAKFEDCEIQGLGAEAKVVLEDCSVSNFGYTSGCDLFATHTKFDGVPTPGGVMSGAHLTDCYVDFDSWTSVSGFGGIVRFRNCTFSRKFNLYYCEEIDIEGCRSEVENGPAFDITGMNWSSSGLKRCSVRDNTPVCIVPPPSGVPEAEYAPYWPQTEGDIYRELDPATSVWNERFGVFPVATENGAEKSRWRGAAVANLAKYSNGTFDAREPFARVAWENNIPDRLVIAVSAGAVFDRVSLHYSLHLFDWVNPS